VGDEGVAQCGAAARVRLVRTVPHVIGRERTTLVTLTEQGRDLLDRQPPPLHSDARQAFYAGVVKPRELAHDTRLYPAYIKAVERLESRGARVRRVVLEEELKSTYQRFLQHDNRGRRTARAGRHVRRRRSSSGHGSIACPVTTATWSSLTYGWSTRSATAGGTSRISRS